MWNFLVVSGRMRDFDYDKHELTFELDAKTVSMDVPGNSPTVFYRMPHVTMAIRRRWFTKTEYLALAYCRDAKQGVRAAGVWRHAIMFIVGLMLLIAMVFVQSTELPKIMLGIALASYGGYRLAETAAAMRRLRAHVSSNAQHDQ